MKNIKNIKVEYKCLILLIVLVIYVVAGFIMYKRLLYKDCTKVYTASYCTALEKAKRDY